MKAILILDMPKTCSDCPCYDDMWYCGAVEKAFDNQEKIREKRADWCPLKPYDEEFIKEAVNDYGRLDNELEGK